MSELVVLESFIEQVQAGDIFVYDESASFHRSVEHALYHGWRKGAEADASPGPWSIKVALTPGRLPAFRATYEALRSLAQATAPRQLSPAAALVQDPNRPDYAGLVMPFYARTLADELQERLITPVEAERFAVAQAVQYTILIDAAHESLDSTCPPHTIKDLRWHDGHIVALGWDAREPLGANNQQQEPANWGKLWFAMLAESAASIPAQLDHEQWEPAPPAQTLPSVGLRHILRGSQAGRYTEPAALRADLEAWLAWLDRSLKAIRQQAESADAPDMPLPGADALSPAEARLALWDLAWRLAPDDPDILAARTDALDALRGETTPASSVAAREPEEPGDPIRQTLHRLWAAAGRDAWHALRRLYNQGYVQVRGDEADALALREGGEPLFWMRDFLQWAPTATPRQAASELENKIAGIAGSSFDQRQTREGRKALVRRALAGWYAAVEDGDPPEATAEAVAARLVNAVYASIRRAHGEVASAAANARTLEQLNPVYDQAAEPLRSAGVRAWWDHPDGIPDLSAQTITGALDSFARKHAFFKQHLGRLLDGEITLSEFIRQADDAEITLTTLPPGRSLTELVQPLTSIEQTAEALHREFEQTLEGLGTDLRRAHEARAALMQIEASQALTHAWTLAYAFDTEGLHAALNEANIALQALDSFASGTQFATEMERLWFSYSRLTRYYDALRALPSTAQEDLPAWRERLLMHAPGDPPPMLKPSERGALVQVIKRIKEPELADSVKFLLELDARLRLEKPTPGEVYVQSEAEQEFYRQYNALRAALIRERDDPASEAHAQATNTALHTMWRKLPALSEGARPLAQDLMRQWSHINTDAAQLRVNLETIAAYAGTFSDPRALLDALHLHVQIASPEAFYLAHADWQAAFDAVAERFAAWSKGADGDTLDVLGDLAEHKYQQGQTAFFDVTDGASTAQGDRNG